MSLMTTRERLRRLLKDFYADEGVGFWRIHAETPLAAMAAFQKKPEVFGALNQPYKKSAQKRAHQHGYISAWMDVLREELFVGA